MGPPIAYRDAIENTGKRSRWQLGMGTRDTGPIATFRMWCVILTGMGRKVSDASESARTYRSRRGAIHAHEHQAYPTRYVRFTGNLAGLLISRVCSTSWAEQTTPTARGCIVHARHPCPLRISVSKLKRPRDPGPTCGKADHYSGTS